MGSNIDVHVFCADFSPKRFYYLCASVAHWNELGVTPRVWVLGEANRNLADAVLSVGCKAEVHYVDGHKYALSRDKYSIAKSQSGSEIVCIADDDILLCPVSCNLVDHKEWWEDYVRSQFRDIPEMNACSPIPRPKLHPSNFSVRSPVVSEAIGGIVFARRISIPDKLIPGNRLPSYDREFASQVGECRYMPCLFAYHLGEYQSTIVGNDDSPELFDAYRWGKKLGKT